MSADSTYRWVRPLKVWEYFTSHSGMSMDEADIWLRRCAEAGHIRVQWLQHDIQPSLVKAMLDDYFETLRIQGDESKSLPPNLYFNRPDIEKMLTQRTTSGGASPRKSRGRPRHAGSLAQADYPLVIEMNKLVTRGIASPHAAATRVVAENASAVPGAGTPESKAKRLVRHYLQTFGDRR